MFKTLRGLILSLLIMLCYSAYSQEVSSSENINIRSDYGYEIIGDVNDQILLYRDRGFEQLLMVFDKSLEFVRERELDTERKKSKIYGLAKKDTSFLAFYGYKEDGNEYVRVGSYNEFAEVLDTMTIFEKKKTFFGGTDFSHLLSEDKRFSMLYTVEKKNDIIPIVFDNQEMQTTLLGEYKIENRNIRKDLVDIQVTNQGDIIMLLEMNNSRFNNDKHIAEIIFIQGHTGAVSISQVDLKDVYTQSIHLSYDNYRRNVSVSGLYNSKSSSESIGYFFAEKPIGNPRLDMDIVFSEFDQNFINDVYGTKSNKKKGIKDFRLVSSISRQDGGKILIAEMQKRFSRNPSYDTNYGLNTYNGGVRAWVDYFNEDMVVIALRPGGEEHWKKVMYKKQFSQDDGAIFSSFFLFKTPSRVRVIYNDEIKKDNIVSEYVFGPLGKNKRQSIFSTEYQNLKLRLKDAIQISGSELLIPSERNRNLSIVKISYL